MSTLSLYQFSAPIFTSKLKALSGCLDKAEAFAAAKKFDAGVFCIARLAPDMFSLSGQIHLATAFAKNAVCRLTGQTPPDYAPLEDSFAAYRARIEQTLGIIAGIPEDAYKGAEDRVINMRISADGYADFSGVDYLNKYSMPQFYFHCAAAYALLRHNGVEIGKIDFMGSLT
jgi:hypothetical protein